MFRPGIFTSLLLVGLLVAGLLTGCRQKPAVDVSSSIAAEVPETGRVIEVATLNGGTATTTPGDILYLKLSGQGGSKNQWLALAPTSSDLLKLKSQEVNNLNQAGTEATFEWWFKVEKIGQTKLQFDYQKIGQKPSQNFQLDIISQ